MLAKSNSFYIGTDYMIKNAKIFIDEALSNDCHVHGRFCIMVKRCKHSTCLIEATVSNIVNEPS